MRNKKKHKKVKMKGELGWIAKRIERARARHELARLGMGTIFLVRQAMPHTHMILIEIVACVV